MPILGCKKVEQLHVNNMKSWIKQKIMTFLKLIRELSSQGNKTVLISRKDKTSRRNDDLYLPAGSFPHISTRCSWEISRAGQETRDGFPPWCMKQGVWGRGLAAAIEGEKASSLPLADPSVNIAKATCSWKGAAKPSGHKKTTLFGNQRNKKSLYLWVRGRM